ncbi:transposase [uncultured Actinomyces sp.]|uniref:transposase n=1 Tax=uncultured Actinomyces sp. TaxID=249061 RepID=UPI0028D59522|nr:transposase [uncultured Actinomyces sp.]
MTPWWVVWGAWCFSDWGSFSSLESIGWIPCQQRDTPRSSAQVVREVIEKERTISSVASSYDLVPQTVGNWVARYRKEHATDQDRKKASESTEIAKLRAEVRELRQENEFLKKAAAWLAKERP